MPKMYCTIDDGKWDLLLDIASFWWLVADGHVF